MALNNEKKHKQEAARSSASGGAGITAVYQRDANIVVKALEDAIASITTH